MRVALVTPGGQTAAAGNMVQAQRLVEGLRSKGVTAEVTTAAAADGLVGFDLYHVLNAHSVRGPLLHVLKRCSAPFTVTCTGTDVLLRAMRYRRQRKDIGEVLRLASGVAVLHEGMRQTVASLYPECVEKIRVIRQGPVLPAPVGEGRADWGVPEDAFVFLLPAGLRPVKRPLWALRPLERLQREHPHLLWLVAGPVRQEPQVERSWKRFAAGRGHATSEKWSAPG